MTKRRWPFVAAMLAAVTAAMLTVGAGAALAKKQPVACGQVIMHSIHLRNDLIDCPGPGLVIGANHIKVDLDGHTIDGVIFFQAEDGIRDLTVTGVQTCALPI